jgi:magnesium chelatase subunit D
MTAFETGIPNKTAHPRRVIFPFAAVPGQEAVKRALLWNLVNPRIGGVLIAGEKGTAKSTLVRALEPLAGGMRVVELPLNCTEDRLVGAIDLKAALRQGRRVLETGLLGEADGNILYVDEVNLLSEHLVHALLGAASSGENVVEREGISARQGSRFVLIGTMNQEEGKLGPQLTDRFGLYVEALGEKDLARRVEILKRCIAFEAAPAAFSLRYREETEALKNRIAAARLLLPEVKTGGNALALAAGLAAQANCAGHRGELALIETARAAAALGGRREVNLEDLRLAAEYALPHRVRESVGEVPPQRLPEPPPPAKPPTVSPREAEDPEADPPDPGRKALPDKSGEAGLTGVSIVEGEEDLQYSGPSFVIPQWQDPRIGAYRNPGSGRRMAVRSDNRQGRAVGSRMSGREGVRDLAFDATVRAAAPFQKRRDRKGRAIAIESEDLRIRIREKRVGGCILFVVDASASMGANRQMREVKGAVLSMLNFSYQKRDRVGLIAFRGDRAELLLGITRSVELAQKKLEQLPTGGRTPLARALELAYEVVMGLRMRDHDSSPIIVLVTDGRASSSPQEQAAPFPEALKAAERIGNQGIHTVLLDTENGFIRLHLCQKLNRKLRGTLITMEDLRTEGILRAVSAAQAASFNRPLQGSSDSKPQETIHATYTPPRRWAAPEPPR